MSVSLLIIVSVAIVYLLLNAMSMIITLYAFEEQAFFITLKDLRSYKDSIIFIGCFAGYLQFDYSWGILCSPFTFWYLLYIYIDNGIRTLARKKASIKRTSLRVNRAK